MGREPTIAATIIAENEAENLAELLPQLDWVDQIVVVDGGSTDGTVDVARQYGAAVAVRRLECFASQRNVALELVRCDWAFSIDADERPAGGLPDEIRRRICEQRYAAYRVRIRSEIFGRRLRRSGTQDDRPVRLVRRGFGRWVGAVHEVLRVRGRAGMLDGWLEHRTIPTLEVFLSKVNRYTELAAEARCMAGRPPKIFDPWVRPVREVFRRLIVKQGFLDGPQGWAFCLLSGLSEWVLADRHRRLWQAGQSGVAGRLPAVGGAGTAGASLPATDASWLWASGEGSMHRGR